MFPRWEVLLKHKDVLSLVYGLSDRPDDVIDLICDRGATFFAEVALREFQQECWNPDPVNLDINADTHQHIHVILHGIDELVRKIQRENTKSEIPNINPFWNQHLSVCGPDCSDFIQSRLYVVRKRGWPQTAFVIPETNTNFENGPKNEPVPYVIGIPHADYFFLSPVPKIIQTLGHYHKIVITRVYSRNMCLKEKDLHLEGHLVLRHLNRDIFNIIEEVELLKLQRIFFTEFKMSSLGEKNNGRSFEQVKRWVHFSSNMKSLIFDGREVPASLIEHIAQELYGEVVFQNSGATLSNVMTVPTGTEQSGKDSSLQILSLVFDSRSTQDIKTLVRLNHLPQLRVLHLDGFGKLCLGVLLSSGSPSLEELSLRNITLSKQDINMFMDILTKAFFPKLNCLNLCNISSEYVKMSLSDVKPLSKYGLEINQLKTLTKREYWNEVAEVYLALEKDILSKTKLNDADIGSLVHEMLPTFKELDLSNTSPIGCLGDFLKNPLFSNLSVLDLSNTNGSIINDVQALYTTAQGGKLQRLQTLKLSMNTLTGSLGVLLGNEFKSLETLLLEDTKLSVSDAQALTTAVQVGKLQRLKTLNLSKNNLTGSLEVVLANEFKSLQTLLLEDTKLSTSDVQALSTAASDDKLFRLTTLNLSKNNLTDSLEVLLANGFTLLETLLLEDTKLSVSDVQALSTAVQEGKKRRLRTLDLSKNTKLFRLTTLNLSKNTLTDTLPDLLKSEFRLLETLLLEDTKLSVSDVQALFTAVREGKLQRLNTLNLSKNTLSDAMRDLVRSRFNNLTELRLDNTS